MSTHNQVAHAWANKTGRNLKGYAMMHDPADGTIYSWGRHFPIARHTFDRHGEAVVLMTTEERSVSTAKHKSIVRRAIGDRPSFTVPNINAEGLDTGHMANYTSFIARANELMGRAKRARTNGPWYIDAARRMLRDAASYSYRFDLDQPERTIADIDAAWQECLARSREATEKAFAAREVRLRTQRIEQRKGTNPLMVKWLNGGDVVSIYNLSNHALRLRPFVRVKGDRVETSWGADVPLDAALAVFRLAKECRARRKGMAFGVPCESEFLIGAFKLHRIGPTGNIVVGCHDIPFRHQQIAAAKAGIEL